MMKLGIYLAIAAATEVFGFDMAGAAMKPCAGAEPAMVAALSVLSIIIDCAIEGGVAYPFNDDAALYA